MRSQNLADIFSRELHELIDKYREFHIDYATLVGSMAMVQADIMAEARELSQGEDKDEEPRPPLAF